jgi:hypothetical protein
MASFLSPTTPACQPGERAANDVGLSAIVGMAALLPRLYVAIAWPREPVWDGHYYEFAARRIAAGLGYSDGVTKWHPWCHWPVGYSGILAAVYKVFGSGLHTATLANVVFGTVLAVMLHRLARYQLDRTRAFVAGLLCALSPGLIVYTALVMTEPLSALALVLTGWVLCRYRTERPMLAAGLGGAVLGLGTLVHPTFVAFAPALGLLLGPDPASIGFWAHARRMAKASALATVCALLPVLPWTARNCRVMDRCAFVSTNGGWNLAIGAFPRATGRFETLRSTDGCAVVTGQVQQDTCWRDVALRYIVTDTRRWLGLIPKKLSYTFDHESFQIEYLHEADPDRWPEDRRSGGRKFLTTCHRILLTLAALGLCVPGYLAKWPSKRTRTQLAWGFGLLAVALALSWYCWAQDDSPFYLLAVLIAVAGLWPFPIRADSPPVFFWAALTMLATIATRIAFFGEDRYHIVITPMLCLFAAGFLRSDTTQRPATESPPVLTGR